MSFSRKFELISGAVTLLALVAIIIAGIYDSYETSQQLSREFSLSGEFKALRGSLWLILPSLMVAIGAFAHALKEQAWGLIPLYLGGLFLAVMLPRGLLLFLAYQRADFFLYLLWWLAAIATMVGPFLALILDKDE